MVIVLHKRNEFFFRSFLKVPNVQSVGKSHSLWEKKNTTLAEQSISKTIFD